MESETAYLQTEPDYYDSDDVVWRCAPGELKIKKKTWGPTGTTGWKLHSKYATLLELAAAWERVKDGGIQAVTVEVLPPAERLPAVQVDHTPEELTNQWRRANAGLLEIVRFGAMLVEIDMSLKRQTHKGGCFQTGDSLKTWMDENCPDINYKTAMGYKVVAEQMRDKYKVPAKLPLTLALPQSDGTIKVSIPDTINIPESRVETLQREFFGMCEGKSMYQLTLDLGIREPKRKGGAREGSGRPQAQLDSVLAAGAAWGRIGPAIDRATAWKFERFLPEAMCREALSTLAVLQDALKARLEELTGKGK